MVSKNNKQLQKQLFANHKVPHYSLRKLGIGVVSVLLGTTMYLGTDATVASAEITENNDNSNAVSSVSNVETNVSGESKIVPLSQNKEIEASTEQASNQGNFNTNVSQQKALVNSLYTSATESTSTVQNNPSKENENNTATNAFITINNSTAKASSTDQKGMTIHSIMFQISGHLMVNGQEDTNFQNDAYNLGLGEIQAVYKHDPATGKLECSSDMLDKIQSSITDLNKGIKFDGSYNEKTCKLQVTYDPTDYIKSQSKYADYTWSKNPAKQVVVFDFAKMLPYVDDNSTIAKEIPADVGAITINGNGFPVPAYNQITLPLTWYLVPIQKANLKFVDQDAIGYNRANPYASPAINSDKIKTTFETSGGSGSQIDFDNGNDSIQGTLKALKGKGYEYVSDNFANGVLFDNDKTIDQYFVFIMKHGTHVVTPDKDKTNLEKEVTRTINYVDTEGNKVNGSPDGKSQVVQTVNFTRTAIVDKVTGDLLGYDTDGDGKVDTQDGDRAWNPASDSFGEVQSKTPSEVGYSTVDKAVVSSATTTPTGKNIVVTVTYGNKLHTYTTGKTEEASVTRTINYYDGQTGEKIPSRLISGNPVTQTVNFERTQIIENGKVVGYGTLSQDGHSFTTQDWHTTDGKTAEWASQVSPDLTANGYKAPRFENKIAAPVVGEQGVTATTQDVTVNVYYDHDTVPVNPTNPGKPDQPVNPNDPNGPKYPSGTSITDLQKTITRTIQYQGAGEYTPETVTQNVNFTAHGVLDKVTGDWVSPLTWSADQEFSAKTSPKIPGYHVVNVDKDADGTNVSSAKIGHEGQNYTVTVTYAPDAKAEQGSLVVQFHDDTDGVDIPGVGTNTGNVDAGTKVTYNSDTDLHNLEDRGYVYVSTDGTIPTEIIKGATTVTIHVKHATRPVTPDNPVDPDHPVDPQHPDNPSNKNPQPGLGKTDLEKTITRHVNYIFTDGTQPDAHGLSDQTQTVTFHGEGTIDLVTGNLVNVDKDDNITGKGSIQWTSDNNKMDEVAGHAVTGYHISGTTNANSDGSVNGLTINPTDTVQDATIIYTPDVNDKGSINVTVHDVTTNVNLPAYGKTSSEQNVGTKFDYDLTKTIKDLTNEGYKIINANVTIPGQITKGTQNIVIYVEHGAHDKNIVKNGTQTVHYTGAGKRTPQDNIATIHFTHSIVIDAVTGKVITDNGWTPTSQAYQTVVTPIVDGYTADKKVAGGATISASDDDLNRVYVVNYTKNSTPVEQTQHAVVIYQDINNPVQVVELGRSGDLTGQAGTKINYSTKDQIQELLNKGYELVKDGFGNDAHFDDNDQTTQTYYVTFKHGQSPVNPKHPNNKVDPTQYLKPVISAVHYEGAGNQTPADNVQHALWTRTLTIDNVTGKIVANGKYDQDWISDHTTYNQVVTPTIKDYTPDKDIVPSSPVTMSNQYTVVTYAENSQHSATPSSKTYSWRINYVDENGAKLSTSIDGGDDYHTGDYFDGSKYQKDSIIIDGKTYKLVLDKSNNISGKFSDHNEITTFVYRMLPESIIPTQTKNPGKQNKVPEKPTIPICLDQPEQPVTQTKIVTSNKTINASASILRVSKKAQNTLPQTGNNTVDKDITLGILSLLGTFLIGLDAKKRRHD